jgi:hypothetical protein
MVAIRRLVVVVLVLLCAVARGRAQEVGAVAAREGTAEIGRAGAWTAAEPGAAVQLGDTLRTGAPGRLQVVLRDDSVLNLGENTELVVDRQVFDPDRRHYQSLLSLIRGKVRAVVSDLYREPQAAFEVETTAAVAGVRGTEFVMTHDPTAAVSEVVGVRDAVAVHGVRDRKRGVLVSVQELTVIRRGQAPTTPRRLDDELFRQYLRGLEFIGGGRAESLAVGHPLARGTRVGDVDRAATVVPPARVQPGTAAPAQPGRGLVVPDAGNLVGQSPGVVEQREQGTGDVGIEF